MQDLKVVVNGSFPLILLVVGIFMIWMQLDEMRIDRNLRSGERRRAGKR